MVSFYRNGERQEWDYISQDDASMREAFVGHTFTNVTYSPDDNVQFWGNDYVLFESPDRTLVLTHMQDCCESVSLEDTIGNLDDLVGSPITMAEVEIGGNEHDDGSETWTFYKFATVKGYVTLRWYGSSNGYYSESVDIIRKKESS